MSANFKIKPHKNKEGLFLELIGDFDGNSAWELINMIMRMDRGKGCIIVNVENLGEVIPFGSAVFRNLMKAKLVPVKRMVFQGTGKDSSQISGYEVLAGEDEIPRRQYRGRRYLSRSSIC